MKWFYVLFFVLAASLSTQEEDNLFPEDFWFGVSTSAFQIEGAWDEDGRGPSIWDTYIHNNPSLVSDQSNADVACDSYHKWQEDVQLLVDLGVKFYRFSISWSRILPDGFSNYVNPAGVIYYQNLILELKKNKIEPLVTMYHWDLPQKLQDAGGWTNPDIIYWFKDYAQLLFDLFGEYVKIWMTFNEPISICQSGYGNGSKPPGLTSNGIGDYTCAHNLLQAHAKVWHLYDETYRWHQKGQVGIALDGVWFQPESDSAEDEAAAQTARQFYFGWFAHPLIKGDYPDVMREHIDRRSYAGNYSFSRLPSFSKQQIEYLKGTVDILGVNLYTSYIARSDPNHSLSTPGWIYDIELYAYQSPYWPGDMMKVTPWAMKNWTEWIRDNYGNPTMIITENGYADTGALEDDDRILFLVLYLNNLRYAILDGVNVIGYAVWSLMDSFEGMSGYIPKMGLYHVDFDSANRTRTPRKSADYYKMIVKTRCLVVDCNN